MCCRKFAGNFFNKNHATAKIHHLEHLEVGVRKLLLLLLLLRISKKERLYLDVDRIFLVHDKDSLCAVLTMVMNVATECKKKS
jgi:hypothetical protein